MSIESILLCWHFVWLDEDLVIQVFSTPSQPLGIYMCNSPVETGKLFFCCFPLPTVLKIFSPPSSLMSLEYLGTCPLHGDQLQVSMLVTTYYKKKLVWRGMRDTLLCRYNDKSLGVSMTLSPFSRSFTIGSPHSLWYTLQQVLGPLKGARNYYCM